MVVRFVLVRMLFNRVMWEMNVDRGDVFCGCFKLVGNFWVEFEWNFGICGWDCVWFVCLVLVRVKLFDYDLLVNVCLIKKLMSFWYLKKFCYMLWFCCFVILIVILFFVLWRWLVSKCVFFLSGIMWFLFLWIWKMGIFVLVSSFVCLIGLCLLSVCLSFFLVIL